MSNVGVLADFWGFLPKEFKFLFVLAIFLYAGSTLMQVIVILWNLLGVNAVNAINGCLSGNPAVCIPEQKGVFIFGINFADYWTITVLMVFLPLVAFALKWYGMMLKHDN